MKEEKMLINREMPKIVKYIRGDRNYSLEDSVVLAATLWFN